LLRKFRRELRVTKFHGVLRRILLFSPEGTNYVGQEFIARAIRREIGGFQPQFRNVRVIL
jgi:hypothetical protein